MTSTTPRPMALARPAGLGWRVVATTVTASPAAGTELLGARRVDGASRIQPLASAGTTQRGWWAA